MVLTDDTCIYDTMIYVYDVMAGHQRCLTCLDLPKADSAVDTSQQCVSGQLQAWLATGQLVAAECTSR